MGKVESENKAVADLLLVRLFLVCSLDKQILHHSDKFIIFKVDI